MNSTKGNSSDRSIEYAPKHINCTIILAFTINSCVIFSYFLFLIELFSISDLWLLLPDLNYAFNHPLMWVEIK